MRCEKAALTRKLSAYGNERSNASRFVIIRVAVKRDFEQEEIITLDYDP
ncbi:MAG TPA: hypothetical protein PLP19_13140 [bacterium]|nr:hypothetical protein [bacterium]HPN44431.1 hypothetical protein [bacterium]